MWTSEKWLGFYLGRRFSQDGRFIYNPRHKKTRPIYVNENQKSICYWPECRTSSNRIVKILMLLLRKIWFGDVDVRWNRCRNVTLIFPGPAYWGLMNPQWSMCSRGRRQSPINVEPDKLLFDPHLQHIHLDKHKVSIIWMIKNKVWKLS